MIEVVFAVVSFVLVFFLLLPFGEVVFSLFLKEKLEKAVTKHYDFGCVITAYKNAKITQPLIESLLQQNYKHFRIYLVADACDVSDFDVKHEKFTLLRPKAPLNLKAKSIIHAIENFQYEHEYIIVFDADNLAHDNFLNEINKYVNQGFKAIQGQRTAKNLNTLYACADSTGEFYKNYVERYIPYLLGSSAVISGSGMAVEAELYKAYLNSPEIERGKHMWKKMLQEDKILQNNLIGKNEKTAYAWNAIVYDEKVTTAQAVETQRSRWLYSYFQNLPNVLRVLKKGFQNYSFNQIFFGTITIAPPLFILLFLTVIMAIAGIWIQPVMSFILLASLLVFITNIFLVLYLSKVPKAVWRAIWGMPFFVFNQVKALFKIGNPNKNFKHTEHSRKVSIDEIRN